MLSEQVQSPSILGNGNGAESIYTIQYSLQLVDELIAFLSKKHHFQTLLIDARESGFLFPAQIFIEVANLSKQLLDVRGSLVFLTADKAVAITRDSLMGELSMRIFSNYAELFDYSPELYKHIYEISGPETTFMAETTDLAQQVLMSSIPVLTEEGIKMKATQLENAKRNLVLTAIDNFAPVGAITMHLAENYKMVADDLFSEMKALEAAKAIYPVFPKIPFLVNCFRNRIAFTLKDYFLAAGLITQAELDEILIQIKLKPGKEWIYLGPMLLQMGYVNSRQLEVAMQDLAFYGQKVGQEGNNSIKAASEEILVQTLIGYLGTTDPANLLQNFVQNRHTGVLSVEYRDLHFRAQFEEGRLTHAKVGKIGGNKAILEFVSFWSEGVFVFIQRKPPADLAVDACKLTKNLDKLLLEAALSKDNMDLDMKQFPDKLETILEKLPDEQKLLDQDGTQNILKDPKDQTPASSRDVHTMKRLWAELDGLTKLDDAIKKMGDIAHCEGVRAAHLLVFNGLSHMPDIDLLKTLERFNIIGKSITEAIGPERSRAFLSLSLRDAIGYSQRGRMFIVGASGEIGFDQAAALYSHASLSQVLKDLEDWQVKYIEYVSQEINSADLMKIIQEVHS